MTAPRRLPVATLASLLVSGALAVGLVGLPSSTAQAAGRPAVVEQRVIGHSVAGRPIRAFRVGNPRASTTAVAMATMHGNEPAPRQILTSLRDGAPVRGVDLWLVPVVNPDGLARHTRKNARGVDLNRNFPFHWAPLDGGYESGPYAASEPETRALLRFFSAVRPDRVVSFHQPLNGVDISTRSTRAFAVRLADTLRLPRRNLTCGGTCYGTFTEWYNHRFDGKAVTVEYGAHPTRHRMRVTAPRQLLAALGGRR